MGKVDFFAELEQRCKLVQEFILDQRFTKRFSPEDVEWAATAYIRYGGKRLRPAILLFSCGAVGGEEAVALPAAAAVELFHTWTLVHDDIIDRDNKRRGNDTVHYHFAQPKNYSNSCCTLTPEQAQHYGVSIAIMTGDIQHGWGISMMTELTTRCNLPPEITLHLINELDTNVLNTLVEGEVLDIQFAHREFQSLTPSDIEDMLWKKTGALYDFCGRAGAMIGLQSTDDPRITAVSKFAALCGTAFQLQDDILGVIGKEEKLGKPIGSDLREGKRTLVVYEAYNNAGESDKRKLLSVLGNPDATDDEIVAVTKLLRDLGGISHVADRARTLIEQAHPYLHQLPPSKYRDLLAFWADYMVQRTF